MFVPHCTFSPLCSFSLLMFAKKPHFSRSFPWYYRFSGIIGFSSFVASSETSLSARNVSSIHVIAPAVSFFAEKSKCAYMFAVIAKSLCPSQSWICFSDTPFANRSDAQLCLRSL